MEEVFINFAVQLILPFFVTSSTLTGTSSKSMFAIITSTSMCARDLSRYSLLTSKTRFLTYSPSLWHKISFNIIVTPCVASNLSQATKVRGSVTKFGYLGTYLRYLPTSPTSHHCDNFPTRHSWITDFSLCHLDIPHHHLFQN